MQVSIREDFNGIGMVHHREDLIRQLDDSLRPASQPTFRDSKERYSEAEGSIMEVPPQPVPSITHMYQGAVQSEWPSPSIHLQPVHLQPVPSFTSWYRRAMQQYSELKAVLLEVDEEAMNILTRMPPKLIFFSLLTHRHIQDPI